MTPPFPKFPLDDDDDDDDASSDLDAGPDFNSYNTFHGNFALPQSFEPFAPSTHALPCIIAKPGPAIVTVRPINSDIVSLARLSPLWSRLWNEDGSGRSFQLVRQQIQALESD